MALDIKVVWFDFTVHIHENLCVPRLRTLLLSVLAFTLPHFLLAQKQPSTDYHQHLLSPAVAHLINQPKPFLASDLIRQMDAAGIQRAVILSLAYEFGNPNRPPVENEYAKVKAENDWTADQIKQYPQRLIAFCGVDPLRHYALAEIERCSHNSYLKSGVKLHFGNSDVNLDDPAQVAKLRDVFRSADNHHMAIVVHLHGNVDHHRPYGEKEAKIFLTQVMPAAPHITIQIAHLAGGGGYDDPETDQALSVFVHAIAQHDTRVAHLYFDISGVAGLGEWESKKQEIASRIREIGVGRILFGSDSAWTGFTPVKAVAAYMQLPLTPDEFRKINTNVPPYAELLRTGAFGASARALQLHRALMLTAGFGGSAPTKTFLTLWKDADPDLPILKQAEAEYAKLTQRPKTVPV